MVYADAMEPIADSLTVEREFDLRVAIEAAQGFDRHQLLEALAYSWKVLQEERGTSERLISDALGLDVKIRGPLLPRSLRPYPALRRD